jgi:hypothetical protein
MNGSTRERSSSEYGAAARTNGGSSHAQIARNLKKVAEEVFAKVHRVMHDDDGQAAAVIVYSSKKSVKG